jgi:hypothetical protein
MGYLRSIIKPERKALPHHLFGISVRNSEHSEQVSLLGMLGGHYHRHEQVAE